MTITAVPLRPIKKGSVAKLWAGIVILLGVGIGVAVAETPAATVETLPDGVRIETVKAGTGPAATMGDAVLVNYAGRLASGKQFDSNMGGQPAAFPVAGVVPGFSEGLQHMQAGGRYRLFIPSKLGYGPEDQRDPSTGEVVIPGGSDLLFDVDLHAIRPVPPQAMMGGAGGVPGGDPNAGAMGGGDPAAGALPGGEGAAPPQ